MSQTKIIKNAVLFDGYSEQFMEGASVAIEGDRIREVKVGELKLDGADVIDLKGKFLMPGLLDLHYHAYSISFNMHQLDHMPKPLLVSHAIKLMEGALQRGFTTVRDPGGGDTGLALAVEAGLIDGPRFLYGGKALSQTGGHGDMRPGDEEMSCGCSYSGTICQVVDGVDEVRKVCRDELRKGAHHIKLFISGGVASPSDPMWMPQFTDEEIRAAVYEANSRRKYVVVHCHTDDGALRSVRNGVRSIDHATEVSSETAKIIAASGTTFAVPTIAVVKQILEYGPDMGMFPESLEKIKPVLNKMLTSIENMHSAGVKMGMGTDLFGPEYHHLQSNELEYRGEVQPAIDVLRSATSINAEIAQMKGEVGEISAGAFADMIVLDGNPLDDLSIFQKPEKMPLIMKGGVLKRNLL
jgi:imidazolonepropionase-like amidohydrolase